MKVEHSIKDMRIRHKAEIKYLQDNCQHAKTKVVEAVWDSHIICVVCGKVIEVRSRGNK